VVRRGELIISCRAPNARALDEQDTMSGRRVWKYIHTLHTNCMHTHAGHCCPKQSFSIFNYTHTSRLHKCMRTIALCLRRAYRSAVSTDNAPMTGSGGHRQYNIQTSVVIIIIPCILHRTEGASRGALNTLYVVTISSIPGRTLFGGSSRVPSTTDPQMELCYITAAQYNNVLTQYWIG